MDYKAVIFDFDYTLGDATDAIFAGFRHGFSVMGYPEPDGETVRHTVGMLLEDAYTQLTGDATGREERRFGRSFPPWRGPCRRRHAPCEGAGAFARAAGSGVATAVVSTKHTETLESIFAQHGLLDVFSFVIGGDKVRRPSRTRRGSTLLWSGWAWSRSRCSTAGIPSSTPGPRTTPGRISARSSTDDAGRRLCGVSPRPYRAGPARPETVSGPVRGLYTECKIVKRRLCFLRRRRFLLIFGQNRLYEEFTQRRRKRTLQRAGILKAVPRNLYGLENEKQ